MNFDFTKHLLNIIKHQKQHTQNLLIELDDSCEICYPVVISIVSTSFNNFVTWYQKQYPAVNFTSKTVEYFYKFRSIYQQFELPQHKNLIFKLIYSIRYNNSPGDIREIIGGIGVLSLYTKCFEKNLLYLTKEELDNPEPVDQLKEKL